MIRFNNLINRLAILSFAMLSGVALTCCSGDVEIGPPEEEEPESPEKKWDMTIEAVMEGGTRTEATAEDFICFFSTEDRVYVYNVTQKSFFEGSLKPQTGGSSTTILIPAGELKGIAEDGDKLKLIYVPNDVMPEGLLSELQEGKDPWELTNLFNPCQAAQKGLQSEVMNYAFAKSEITVESAKDGVIQVSEGRAEFTQLQSIFHLSFRFEDREGNEIDAKEIGCGVLTITFAEWGPVIYHNNLPLDGKLYMALPMGKYRKMTFYVLDEWGTHMYWGVLDAPEGTFYNGKIYILTEPIIMRIYIYITKV